MVFDAEQLAKEVYRSAIRAVYNTMLGRDPSLFELEYLIKKRATTKDVVDAICVAYEDEVVEYVDRQETGKLPLTLAIFAKNNEDSIHLPLKSVHDLVEETVVVDTGSTDSTIAIAESFGARVYRVGFTDFGSIRTVTALLGTQPWVLGLDTDEIIAPEELHMLRGLLSDKTVPAWGLPRRRWADLERTKQVELGAYPDRQYRLLRRSPLNVYKNRVHERLDCLGGKPAKAADGPHIEHFQDVFKQGSVLAARNVLYKELYGKDVADGVVRNVPAVAPMDDKC